MSFEFGMLPFDSVFVPASIAPVLQLLFVKTVYFTVPVGLGFVDAPERVEVSCTAEPTGRARPSSH